MQRFFACLTIYLGFAATIAAQIGKNVSVAAGSDEDRALATIYATPDGPAKVALLDKFMADFGKGDLELLADQLYVQTFLAQKNYAKVYEFGDKALRLDPLSFSTVVNMVHAAEEQGDVQKLFEEGEKAAATVARYKASPPPAGTDAKQWEDLKADGLKGVQADIAYIQYGLVNAAYKTADISARLALFDRYVTAFPDSPYTLNMREQTALAYQQAQNFPKMADVAQSILATDPNDISMLLLLADYWSENGQQLDKAAENAKTALGLLPQAKKPENVSDDQWQKQIAVQKGLALSSLGAVYLGNGRNAQAVDAFKQASPLLKPDAFSYARNLYRLGFTLAKMKRIPEARVILKEAASINSPYKARAQETLEKINRPHQ
jgi:tetratricopeptide (TPR) repeat protein